MATHPYRPSKALFTVTDPEGVVITLEKNCWYGHILRGHPEMRRRLTDVEHALLRPTEIHENFEQRRLNLVYYYTDAPAGTDFRTTSKWPSGCMIVPVSKGS